MTGKQAAVLWIGLIIVSLNLVMRWAEIRSILFHGAGLPSGSGSGGTSTKPGLMVPVGGGKSANIPIPLPGGGGVTLP